MNVEPDESSPPRTDNMPSETTAEGDRMTAGQRRVNLIWEFTQAFIAVMVVSITIVTSSLTVRMLSLSGASDQQVSLATTAFLFMSNIASLVVGFYFGRTNHQRVGGIGGANGPNTR